MPFHPQPVVEPLKRQLCLFGDLQLYDAQTPIGTGPEQIDIAITALPDSRHLAVEKAWEQIGIQCPDITTQDRFQPCLACGAVKRMLPVGTAWAAIAGGSFYKLQ